MNAQSSHHHSLLQPEESSVYGQEYVCWKNMPCHSITFSDRQIHMNLMQ